MLKESGNLIEEGIPITKELLDFAKANNYKISLKTGEYSKNPIPTTRGQRYNKDLISAVHTIYYAGNLYLTDYFEVFGFSKPESLTQAIKQCGFKLLSRKETQEIYGEQILQLTEETNMDFYGCKAPTQNPEVVEKGRQTCIRKFEVDNYFKSAKFKEQRRVTMLDRYEVEHNMQNPELREKAMKTWADNNNLDEPTWLTSIPAVRESIKQSMMENHQAESYVATKEFRDIMDHRDFRRAVIREIKETRTIQGELVEDSEIVEFITDNYSQPYTLEQLKILKIKTPANFTTELKLSSILSDMGCNKIEYSGDPTKFENCRDLDFVQNAKKLHGVKMNTFYHDMDFFFPKLRIGIEVNGRAFHAVNKSAKGRPKDKEYHFEKFKAFRESGISMLSFTDYEQDHFKDDVIGIIKHHLTGEPLNISKEFLEFNQITSIEESLNYGLFDPNRFTGNFEDHQHQRFIGKFEYWDCGVIKS